MDYRPVKDWDEQYLEEVLDDVGRVERNHIEFKSSYLLQLNQTERQRPHDEQKDVAKHKEDEFRELLAKALSAFGNRNEGGYFVVGVNNSGEVDGGLELSYKNGPKEWFDRIIPTLTDKESLNCEVHPIRRREAGESHIRKDHAVIVIWVPPHPEMPVRSTEGKHDYYYRTNAQSVPLDHQQVLDIIHRRSTPRMRIKKIQFDVNEGYPADRNRNEHPISLRAILTNCSNRLAVRSALDVFLPHWLFHGQRLGYHGWNTVGMHRLEKQYSVSTTRLDIEVFPRQPVQLAALDLIAKIKLTDTASRSTPLVPLDLLLCPEIGFVIYADDAPPSAWKLRVDRSPTVARILAEILESYDTALPLEEDVRRFSERSRVLRVEDAIREHLGIPVEATDLTELGVDSAS